MIRTRISGAFCQMQLTAAATGAGYLAGGLRGAVVLFVAACVIFGLINSVENRQLP